MSVVDSRYDRLSPRGSVLQDEVVLAQAWKKTHTFIRRHNWYADVLELDASAVCLSRKLSQWSRSISSGNYRTAPAWLVPAPKNGLWSFRSEGEGGWGPRELPEGKAPALRPLAHIGIKEQTVATAVMLCLANCIESSQGDTSLEPAAALDSKVYSYGNRLFCTWSDDHRSARFAWGNSDTYSRYFQDYQRFAERPIAIATGIEAEEERVFIVSLDIRSFFDNIDVDLLILKMRQEYAEFLNNSLDEGDESDELFWTAAQAALTFKWRPEDELLSGLFRDEVLPTGLPQGLVGSGFFANAYLLAFDRALGSYVDRQPPNCHFRVHDYCRYVDDLRIVISVDTDKGNAVDVAVLTEEISGWVQKLLKKHTRPAGKPTAFLKLNASKTQLEPLVEVGSESGTAARMKALQQQMSGPFDLDSLKQTEAGLNGLLSLAELGLLGGSDSSQVDGTLRLASVAKLKLEVRDDTLTRFSAYRLVRSLRMRRSMTELSGSGDPKEATEAKESLIHDYQAVARRLVSAWAVNPSLVQVLRYALDLYPSTDLLESVEQALMTKIEASSPDEYGRRVAFYVLADLFRAGATETGKQADSDASFHVTDVSAYRGALACLAKGILDLTDVPWYVQQQASLLLASLGKPANLNQDAKELRFYRVLNAFVKNRAIAKEVSAQEEVVISLVGHQILCNIAHYERWFIRFSEKSPKGVSNAWKIIAQTFPDLSAALLRSKRVGIQKLRVRAPLYLRRYDEAKWSEGFDMPPTWTWIPLLTAISHPAGLFSQENALLILARAIARDETIKRFDPEQLTPLNVKIRCKDWSQLNNPRDARLEAHAVSDVRTTDGTYDTPAWCRSTDAWMYAFGRLLRAAATGEPDFTARHWLAREDSGWYTGLRSTWQKRRMGMLHTAEGLGGTTAAITPWFSNLLLHLLRWPGIAGDEDPEFAAMRKRRDFRKAVSRRIKAQSLIFGESSSLPIYRYPVEWPLSPGRGLRVVMVQGLMPMHADFGSQLDGLEVPGYREKHRSHTAALLHLTTKHLATRDNVLGRTQKPHFDLVVFPELSIHDADQDLMRAFSDATGAMLFYGLLGAKKPGTGEAINTGRWLVPQRRANRRSWVQVDQGKFHLTPEEIELGIKSWRPYQVVIELLDSSNSGARPYRLTGSICFDATDLALAADLRDESHMYVVAAMNKDVKTFDGMVAALRYHMYQHILIVNIGEYGGSTAQAPYDKEHLRLISHSHGSKQIAISIFDVRTQDFGPELQAANPGVTTMQPVTSRIGKAPPAGLRR
ncbi:RNA-directed DNA polymerase [Pseudomonas tremae]|uniref:RNA-directed DNA polymerase n=1 Tax=Pseudomonas tremae TaxID=200454 RepID=UPI001F319BD3|nr:RNA-directed DNA polymerase [Pseudomonas tremae]MCF5715088.1 hypothetical protein [Pseudomonas tremae]